jgi:hypothetical protein
MNAKVFLPAGVQLLNHLAINLYDIHFTAPSRQPPREHTATRADFQNPVGGRQISSAQNFFDNTEVTQKILAETPFRREGHGILFLKGIIFAAFPGPTGDAAGFGYGNHFQANEISDSGADNPKDKASQPEGNHDSPAEMHHFLKGEAGRKKYSLPAHEETSKFVFGGINKRGGHRIGHPDAQSSGNLVSFEEGSNENGQNHLKPEGRGYADKDSQRQPFSDLFRFAPNAGQTNIEELNLSDEKPFAPHAPINSPQC